MTGNGPRTLPYGSWPSSIRPSDLAGGQVRLDEVRLAPGPDGHADVYWLEARPQERGRQVVVRSRGGVCADVVGPEADVRSRVHEYGGGAYALAPLPGGGTTLVYSDVRDGSLHRVDLDVDGPGSVGAAVAVAPGDGLRYGGLVLSRTAEGPAVLLAVREDHRGVAAGTDPEPRDTLVRLALDVADPLSTNAHGGEILWDSSDFVLRPALSPDARRLAWVTFDHPSMPWDATVLRVGELTEAGLVDVEVLAGGDDPHEHPMQESVVQPCFGPDGALYFVSDRDGSWNLYRHDPSGQDAVQLTRLASDMATPQWVLGMCDLALLPPAQGGGATRVLVHHWSDDRAQLAVLDTGTGELIPTLEGAGHVEQLVALGDTVAVKAGWPDRLPEVLTARVESGSGAIPWQVVARSSEVERDPADVSPAEPRTWQNSDGLGVHGFLHRPASATCTGPEDELPPLLVVVHGGPTSRSEASYSSAIQFWTTRGFAVLDVNYSGSTGYGRAYRERLQGRWGQIDVDDCVTGALALADAGLVDRGRLAVRGGSAGGYLVLQALTTSAVFAAGCSLYGISDLDALSADTHKFESRYDQGLIGGPPGSAVYRDRSPIHRVGDLHGRLLLLQGSEDRVVPAAQAEAMARAMRDAGKEVDLVVYEGEAHGFRRAETIVDALERELAFYGRVFGFTPAGEAGSR